MIMHHISDSHDWHFAHIGETHLTLPLPVILYSKDRGLEIFSSSKFHNDTFEYNGYKLDAHDHIHSIDESRSFYDLSITKNVASLLLSAVLLMITFVSIGNTYKKNKLKSPRGIQSFFEPIIMYVRDDIAKPSLGSKADFFLPYLLTIFFFIWFNNLLGLVPGGANVTGNIAITMTLAFITFLITNLYSNSYYWGHILNPPGIPFAVKILLVPVELMGIFTKPFSLMIRLFANITAGHIIILSLLALIFIFKSAFISIVSVPFAVFMNILELFVAILQAYVFTLLSAMYIGSAIEVHNHADHDFGH
ncbi:MAG: ATP synthase F0 subunit A [Cytophagales bacterium]|nr:MAG: ATP synthase F0 subunit A [Cytophagales bacterium]